MVDTRRIEGFPESISNQSISGSAHDSGPRYFDLLRFSKHGPMFVSIVHTNLNW